MVCNLSTDMFQSVGNNYVVEYAIYFAKKGEKAV